METSLQTKHDCVALPIQVSITVMEFPKCGASKEDGREMREAFFNLAWKATLLQNTFLVLPFSPLSGIPPHGYHDSSFPDMRLQMHNSLR